MWDTRSRDGCCLILRANYLFPEKENTSRNQGCLAWHGLTYYLRFFRMIFQHATCPTALHTQTSGYTGFKATREPTTSSNVDFEPKYL